jgi:hypothetical protein
MSSISVGVATPSAATKSASRLIAAQMLNKNKFWLDIESNIHGPIIDVSSGILLDVERRKAVLFTDRHQS